VRVAVDDAQAALEAQKILNISFEWIRFKTYLILNLLAGMLVLK